MPTNHLLRFRPLLAVFSLVALAGLAGAQKEAPPEFDSAGDRTDTTCHAYGIKSLHEASWAGDEASAHVALAHAQAFFELEKWGQSC